MTNIESASENIISAQQQKKSRKSFILVLVVFALPIILAKLALELKWLDLGVTNKGTLLTNELTLTQLGIDNSGFEHQWLILFSLPKQCLSDCEQTLEVVHNTYVALGKEMPRVTPIALYQHTFSETQQQQIARSQWQTMAMPTTAQSIIDHSQVFIVDPLGNVIMSHALPTKPSQRSAFGKQILADMKTLLKLSKVG